MLGLLTACVEPTGSIASRVWPICSSYSRSRPNVSRIRSSDCFMESTALAMCSTRFIFMAFSSLQEMVTPLSTG